MINCRGSASGTARRLGEQSLSVSGGPGEVVWGRGHGKRDADRRGTLARDPPQDRAHLLGPGRRLAAEPQGGARDLCDRAPGPRGSRAGSLPHFLPSGPAARLY